MHKELRHRVRTQAHIIETHNNDPTSPWERRLRRFKRRMLLSAYRKHGNKARAAAALGLTYRQFRYQWDMLV